jgi:predicted metal-dependent peptidase
MKQLEILLKEKGCNRIPQSLSQNLKSRRFEKTLDCEVYLDLILQSLSLSNLQNYKSDIMIFKSEILAKFKKILEEKNMKLYEEYNRDATVILQNLRNRIQFERIASHGPKLPEISEK